MMSLARSHSRRASIVALAEQIYEQESPISGVVMEIDRSRRIAGLTIRAAKPSVMAAPTAAWEVGGVSVAVDMGSQV